MLIMHVLYACKAMSQHASQKGDVASEATLLYFQVFDLIATKLGPFGPFVGFVYSVYQEVPPYLTVGRVQVRVLTS